MCSEFSEKQDGFVQLTVFANILFYNQFEIDKKLIIVSISNKELPKRMAVHGQIRKLQLQTVLP